MPTYVIGDIQGCHEEFRHLLDRIRFDPTTDRLWLVGDLVNRGPASLETLRHVRSLGERVTCVLGNHDLHLLAVAAGIARKGSGDTLEAILAAPDRDELLDWLRWRPLLHVEADRVLVHAGLLPQWDVGVAQALAAEVQQQLRSANCKEFLAGLYGNKPDHWSDSLAGPDRWRVIVNAMTRMRFATAQGVMEFSTKGELEKPPPGYLPWFEIPGRRSAGSLIIVGHWSALGLKLTAQLAALDTGCVWGGALTALRLDDGKVFQEPSRAMPARHPV